MTRTSLPRKAQGTGYYEAFQLLFSWVQYFVRAYWWIVDYVTELGSFWTNIFRV